MQWHSLRNKTFGGLLDFVGDVGLRGVDVAGAGCAGGLRGVRGDVLVAGDAGAEDCEGAGSGGCGKERGGSAGDGGELDVFLKV